MTWEHVSLLGHYPVNGYFFANGSLPENEIQARILAHWDSLSMLYKLPIGYVLIQRYALLQDVAKTPGAALVKQGGCLSNRLIAIKDADSLLESTTSNAINKMANELCLLYQGHWHQVNLEKESLYSPANWIKQGDYHCIVLHSFAQKNVAKPAQINLGQKKETREILQKESLKPSDELLQVLDHLKQTKHAAKNHVTGYTSQSSPPFYSVYKKIQAGFSRLLMRSPLGSAIGKNQAKFLEDMLNQFKNGNIDEALKKAIPLGTMQETFDSIDHPFTGRFMPRQNLSIGLQKSDSGQSVSLDEQVLNALRRAYQDAFDKLDADGKVEEAAFVLVDLLQAIDQAIQYLEKHKKYRLAAQIAEGHEVGPARIIRQWVLAGDLQRAIQVARLSNHYEQAITLLSKTHSKEADTLRWQLAQMHYQSGDIETAVDIAWPMKNKRQDIIEWLKLSVRINGNIAAKHLIRLAIYDTIHSESYIETIQARLKDDSSTGASCRLSMIHEINQHSSSPACKLLASMAIRPHLRDIASGFIHYEHERWNRLITLSDDQVLRADMSRVQMTSNHSKKRLKEQKKPIDYTLSACHGRHIKDCKPLADGSLLLAFGDAGLELWSQQGIVLASYTDICHHIIVADHGYQALLVALHDDFQIVHVFDLVKRATRYWLQTQLTHWADSYDGLGWIVVQVDNLFILDVQQPSAVSLWSLSDLKGHVVLIKRSRSAFSIVVEDEHQYEMWQYQLPDLFLKERTPMQRATLSVFPADINSTGKMVVIEPNSLTKFGFYSDDIEWQKLDAGVIKQLRLFDSWLYVMCQYGEHNHLLVYWYTQKTLQQALHITYPTDEKVTCYCDNHTLLVYSNTGRVMIIELEYGSIVSDIS